MVGGDSVAGSGWYQEMIIVPNPADDSSYYLFSVGVTYQFGLMYSIIDMRGDGGLGAVTQKNVQLLNFLMVDCILGYQTWKRKRLVVAGKTFTDRSTSQ